MKILATPLARKHSLMARHGKYDCVVIGGGHNGLVCAAYLAKAGRKVCVLERRHVLGGCATTEELWPGYRVSTAAYVISLFQMSILRELRLKDYGIAVGNGADLTVLDCAAPEVAVAELVPVLRGFKRGRETFTREPAKLHRPH